MTQLLENKVCIITGGAGPRGIGKATARLFHEHGATVVIADLDAEKSREAAAEVAADRTMGVACDVTDKASCEAAVKAVMERYGRVDVLINNAGITQPLKTLEITPENYEQVTDVSLRGMLYMSQSVLPHMADQQGGAIVNTSSVSAQRGGGIFGGPHYSAAKAGMLGLAKAMAREYGQYNIRINSVTPGLIQTDITGGKLTDEMKTQILTGIPLNRLGDAQDVAKGFLFLASDLSSYTTGAVLDINGGMHMY
ncbi:NAD(P)-dependent dehydrogenase (short-subunit alcohol dehydrogenase family) [Kushneria sinocarnis]|uniref:NAD(P)-dependent dehydrogenase (Short-subunit alcohol dehydrogenase family) n=1 Tax=Kushneria sinocarnis TaxID=595502 RepID=A0A420WW06_9GAMM|nr:SDR family NAD(P)-dependent oxidoreductase [Kushneria sinocarnis]RKR03270.1 NAD(P)-dependent dehydrogenase (short-subunit alcohol dehydrogenase family) [Kushneria sinocarnis]